MASACASEREYACMVSGTSGMPERGAYLELLRVSAAVGREEPGVDAYADTSRHAGGRNRTLRKPLDAKDSIRRISKHAEAETKHPSQWRRRSQHQEVP